MTRASVVIPSRAGAARLPRLLRALLAQSGTDPEVIVVLDGDIDGSTAVLEQWRDRLDLTAVVFPENRGRSAALNAGFSAASGDVLIRCDDDLEPGPHYVRHHLQAHTAGPVGVIGLYRNIYPDSPYARVYGRGADEAFRTAAYATPPAQLFRYWAGNVSTTRAVFEAVGGYDETYRSYGWEDVDWGYRLHRLGVPIVLSEPLETDHHIPSTTTAIRSKRAYLAGAARRTFEALHGPQALGFVGSPSGVWGACVRGASRVDTEPGIARWAAATDRLLPLLPAPLGRKLVALSVESASLAGYRRPDPDRTRL